MTGAKPVCSAIYHLSPVHLTTYPLVGLGELFNQRHALQSDGGSLRRLGSILLRLLLQICS